MASRCRRITISFRSPNTALNGVARGPEPAQLAFALLYHHLRDTTAAKVLQAAFMRRVAANFDNEWELSSADLDDAVAALRSGQTVNRRACPRRRALPDDPDLPRGGAASKGTPLSVERVSLAPPAPTDVVVKPRAAGPATPTSK